MMTVIMMYICSTCSVSRYKKIKKKNDTIKQNKIKGMFVSLESKKQTVRKRNKIICVAKNVIMQSRTGNDNENGKGGGGRKNKCK